MNKIKLFLLCILFILCSCSELKLTKDNEPSSTSTDTINSSITEKSVETSTLETSTDCDSILEVVENDGPPTLHIDYYFEKALSKDEAKEYIKGIESIAVVTENTGSLAIMPTMENFSSNFLKVGTKLYFVNEGIVAVYDDTNEFYAALLVVQKNTTE